MGEVALGERSVGGWRALVAGKRLTAAVAASVLGAGLVVGGCGSGQITQTDTQDSAVNGVTTNVGAMGLRDAQIAYPTKEGQPAYRQGDSARVVVTIVNNGSQDDQLMQVSSPYFSGARVQGDKKIPARTSIRSGLDTDDQHPGSSPSSSSAAPSSIAPSASSKPQQHEVSIDLTGLKKPALRPGVDVPVKFSFAAAGSKTVQLPIGAPNDAAAADH